MRSALTCVEVLCFFFCACMLPLKLAAQDDTGSVKIPVKVYDNLIEKSRLIPPQPDPAPVHYAFGKSHVQVYVSDQKDALTAKVNVTVDVEILEDRWVSIPLLLNGTAVQSSQVNGKPASFSVAENGIVWNHDKKGVYKIEITYNVDGRRNDEGGSIALSVPPASVVTFAASFPEPNLDVAILPGAGVKTQQGDNGTIVTGTIPQTRSVYLNWRVPSGQTYSISRVRYSGRVNNESVIWKADLDLEIFQNKTLNLELVPKDVTLNELLVDEKRTAILIENGFYCAQVSGKGLHKAALTFEVPVIKSDGPPQMKMPVLKVPISRFELEIPGTKALQVQPGANVELIQKNGKTSAVWYARLCDQVQFSWSEAVPDSVEQAWRASANIYHLLHAEEGVLYTRAVIQYEVTRGETNKLEIEIPADTQVNDIQCKDAKITEWVSTKHEAGTPYPVTVFFDRQLDRNFMMTFLAEKQLPKDQQTKVSPLKAMGVNRQRGMIALLANKELTLKPVEESAVNKVGENQLPAFIRQITDMTIAHTFKYVEADPYLVVEPAKPERKEAKFDVMINTLISLGDVTLKGSSSIELSVKSGSMMDVQLTLPKEANLLNLTAPSLRSYQTAETDAGQVVTIYFTQEMEGQFRVEAVYERITSEAQTDVLVPTPKVPGAEIEQGRIAVEALSAVEVQPARVSQLSSIDLAELPQQLILKTTNPILLAYKYVQVDPPFELNLKITRHKEIDVQHATIDQASYQTLFTLDGLAVTTAQFMVRNSRKQFLRITLPKEAEVWSVFVNGRAEKPAIATETEGSSRETQQVLIKILNSTEGFPVEVIYALPTPKIGSVGKIYGQLPVPDIGVTYSNWDVFIPQGIHYGPITTNMEKISDPQHYNAEAGEKNRLASVASSVANPLKIEVPSSGMHLVFKKLYANRSLETSFFSIAYSSRRSEMLALFLGVFGTLLFWLGFVFKVRKMQFPVDPLFVSLVGSIWVVLTGLILRMSMWIPLWTSLIIAGIAGLGIGIQFLNTKRASSLQEGPPTPPEL